MPAGQYDKRVVIQANTGTADATGEVSPVWTTIASAWASIKPVSGKEFLYAGGAVATGQVKIAMRYNPTLALTPRHRILYGTRIFEINHVADIDEAHIEWQLICTELL